MDPEEENPFAVRFTPPSPKFYLPVAKDLTGKVVKLEVDHFAHGGFSYVYKGELTDGNGGKHSVSAG